MFVIKNGKVLYAIHREPQYVDIRVENGKITEIGPNLIADGGDVIDAAGLTVMPGFVEAHGHIGLDGWGIGFEGHWLNLAGVQYNLAHDEAFWALTSGMARDRRIGE